MVSAVTSLVLPKKFHPAGASHPALSFRPVWLVIVLVALPAIPAMADEWPQWRGPNRDGVWKEKGLVEEFDGDQVPIRWSVPIGSGYSGPTVADGKVYVTDREVDPEQVERIHCFDWKTGEQIWSYSYPAVYENVGYTAGPRAAVSISAGRAFALGTMGHIHCLDAATGEVLWRKLPGDPYQIEMPIWGLAAAPLVEDDLVILQLGAAGGACVVALDVETGKERWRALRDRASYSAPIIVEQAGKRVFLCWTGDHVAGLDPQTGRVYWSQPFRPERMVINVPTPVFDDQRLFLTSFYDGSRMLTLSKDRLEAELLWQQQGDSEQETKALHSMISTPVLDDGYVYGVDSYGQLRCLEAATGKRVWEDLTAVPKARWGTIHFVRNGDRYWMFNERGELLIGKLSPAGFTEISRAKLIDPTTDQLRRRGGVCWAHPAFAYKHVFARSDKELVCGSLKAD